MFPDGKKPKGWQAKEVEPKTNNGLRKKIDKNDYTNAMEMKMERSEEKDAKYTVSETEI